MFRLDSLKIAREKQDKFWRIAYQFRNIIDSLLVDFGNGIKICEVNGIISGSGLFQDTTFLQGNLTAKFRADSLIMADIRNAVLIASPGTFEFSSDLTRKFVPESLFVKIEASDIFDGNLLSTISMATQKVSSIKDLDLQHISGTWKLELAGINLERFAGKSISGIGNLSLDIQSNYDRSANVLAKLTTKDLSIEFDSTEGFELLPDIFLQIKGELNSSPGFAELKFQNAGFNLNNLSNGKIDVKYSTDSGQSSIYAEDWYINLPVVQDYFPAYLRDDMVSAVWEGVAIISSEISIWPGPDAKIYSQMIGDLTISNEIFDNPYWYIRVDSLNLYGVFAGSLNELLLDLQGRVREFKIIDTTPNYSDTQILSYLSIENWDDIFIQSFSAVQPKLNIRRMIEYAYML